MNSQTPQPAWASNRVFQFAAGVTVIFVFLRWLFTGDLLLAVEALRPPEEGETKSVAFFAVLWPMIVETVIIIGVSAIAFGLRIWSFVVGVIDQASGKVDPVEPVQTSVQATAPVVQTDSPEGLVNGLARAVATNDAASENRYKTQIRRPYAMVEMNAALEEGDFDAAQQRFDEIRQLANPSSPKPAKGGAK